VEVDVAVRIAIGRHPRMAFAERDSPVAWVLEQRRWRSVHTEHPVGVYRIGVDGVVLYRPEARNLRGVLPPGSPSVSWSDTGADDWAEDGSGSGCLALRRGTQIELPCGGVTLQGPDALGPLAWGYGLQRGEGWLAAEGEQGQVFLQELWGGRPVGEWLDLRGPEDPAGARIWTQVYDAFRRGEEVCVAWVAFERSPIVTSCFEPPANSAAGGGEAGRRRPAAP
jgi:hypothetical protein